MLNTGQHEWPFVWGNWQMAIVAGSRHQAAAAAATGYLQWLSNCLICEKPIFHWVIRRVGVSVLLRLAVYRLVRLFAGTPKFVIRLKTFNNFMKSRRQSGDADCSFFAWLCSVRCYYCALSRRCLFYFFCMRGRTWQSIVSCHFATALCLCHSLSPSAPCQLPKRRAKQHNSSCCCSLATAYCMCSANVALIAQV